MVGEGLIAVDASVSEADARRSRIAYRVTPEGGAGPNYQNL